MKQQPNSGRRPVVLGWKEYVEFPDWGVGRLKTKIDTGARTSALDAASCDIRETPAGLVAELRLPLDSRHPERLTTVQARVLRTVVVCSSTGVREQRPLIETRIRLGPITKTIRLTVTNRAGMLFRMLLGRKALEGDFVVDVSQRYLCGRRKKSE